MLQLQGTSCVALLKKIFLVPVRRYPVNNFLIHKKPQCPENGAALKFVAMLMQEILLVQRSLRTYESIQDQHPRLCNIDLVFF